MKQEHQRVVDNVRNVLREQKSFSPQLSTVVASLNEQLSAQSIELDAARAEVAKRKEAPSDASMLSLEIADYEKSVARLEGELQQQKSVVNALLKEKKEFEEKLGMFCVG